MRVRECVCVRVYMLYGFHACFSYSCAYRQVVFPTSVKEPKLNFYVVRMRSLDMRLKEERSILTELCELKGCVVSDGRNFVLKEKGAESISCQVSPHINHKVWALLTPPLSSENSFHHKMK
jgi:hypothetical protein